MQANPASNIRLKSLPFFNNNTDSEKVIGTAIPTYLVIDAAIDEIIMRKAPKDRRSIYFAMHNRQQNRVEETATRSI